MDRFAEYAAIVGDAFADRVEHWVPINEPNVATPMVYGIGEHAPGKELLFDSLHVAHHLLLGHGRAAHRPAGGRKTKGCANNHAPIWPASDDDADALRLESCRHDLERDVHRAHAARPLSRWTSRS